MSTWESQREWSQSEPEWARVSQCEPERARESKNESESQWQNEPEIEPEKVRVNQSEPETQTDETSCRKNFLVSEYYLILFVSY